MVDCVATETIIPPLLLFFTSNGGKFSLKHKKKRLKQLGRFCFGNVLINLKITHITQK
jgi:hypothetical protein